VALTGHYLTQVNAVLIFFSAGFLTGVGLLWAVWRRYFEETGFGVVVAGALALGLANFAPGILGRCDMYEVAISCGYALAMLALAGVWGALHDERRRWRWLVAASLAYGLALGARPSLLFGAIILLVPVAQAWREQRRVWPLLLAACGPIVAMGAGLMIYNALRFDNPLEFGQRYQLPLTVHEQFRLRFIWFNFRVGFVDPARWSAHFPFVHDIAESKRPTGYCNVEHPFGVLSNVPLVWLGLAAPLAWRSRPAEASSILRRFLGAVALLFGMCAMPLALHDSMCIRYEVDYAAWLVLLAVIGVLAVERALAGQPAWRRAARCGWGLLLAFSVVFNLLASCEMQAESNLIVGRDLVLTGRVDEGNAHLQKALELEPEDMEVHGALGSYLLQMGRLDEAIIQYQEALRVKPDDMEVHYCLGCIFLHKGQVDEAITEFQTTLRIWPDYAEGHSSLGDALLQKGKVDEAMAEIQKALQIRPDYAEAHNSLGYALIQKGRMDEAITHLQKLVQLKPDDADGYNSLGYALMQKGRMAEAIAEFQNALQIKPADPTFQNNMAWLLATGPQASLRNGVKAVEIARQASGLTGGESPVILHTLAAALAEAGRFSEAVETAQHALRLAEAQSNTPLAGMLRSELTLYQSGSPFHSPAQ
jgi:Flp pilus assembly protein TadD